MRVIRSKGLRGKHAAFLHAALAAPIAVVTERTRVHPRPAVEPLEFVALSLARYLELGGTAPTEVSDPDELRYDLECGYVGGKVDEGETYLVAVPRAQPVVFISEARFRELEGDPGPHEIIAL